MLQQPTYDDPFAFFAAWMAEAETSELNDPNAMTLATVSKAGKPSVRIVLCKEFDTRGFVFYTNFTSRKGQELGPAVAVDPALTLSRSAVIVVAEPG